MNNKKICIIISSILIFIIIICVSLYLYSKNSQKLESSKSLESEEIQNEIIENTTDVEIPEEKSISNEDENQKEINTSIVQEEKEDSKNVAEASSKTSSKKTNTKSIESKAKNTQTETKKTETPKQVENTTTTTTTIIETPKKEEIKEDPKPSQSAPSTNTEKYVKNDAMINKIKNVIQNNESDFMKQYGYNIVVDSSIKAQTNQFTYTENRVKSYITYKFGTIRIYAEDYYVNGNLIMTECYIL